MDYYQREWLAAFERIEIVCDAHPEILASNPLFQKKITRLKVIVVDIKKLAQIQAEDTTVFTDSKNDNRGEAITMALFISGAIEVYARDINDTALMKKMSFMPTSLGKLLDSDLKIALHLILTEAQKLSADALAECGLTADEITAFADSITKYEGSTHGKEIATIDQTGATKQLAILFTEGKQIKSKSLDKLARQFERKAPEFYHKYKAASAITYRIYKKNDAASPKTDSTTNSTETK